MEEKEYSNLFAIPANYTDSGKILGGMLEPRNAIEAVILLIVVGYPELMLIPLPGTIRIVVMTITLLLTLCCFTFCFIFSACNVSDTPETSVPSSIAGPATEEDTSVPQTRTDSSLEATDGAGNNETGPQDSIPVSDSSKTDVKSEAEESSRAPETTDITKPKTESEPATPTLPTRPAESTPPKETTSSQTESEPEKVKTPDPEPTKPELPT